MNIIQGLVASGGYAEGKAWHFSPQSINIDSRQIHADEVESEFQAFLTARERVDAHLEALYQQVLQRQGEEDAAIFESHRELLNDEELEQDIKALIEDERQTASQAVYDYLNQVAATMRQLDDVYMRERAAEFEDLQKNLLLAINNLPFVSLADAPEGSIVVAHDLTPSETAQLNPENVRAFILERGGITSHVAILARNLGIPAVVCVPEALTVAQGTDLIVEADKGTIYVQPDEAKRAQFKAQLAAQAAEEALLQQLHDQPAVSLDGKRFKLYSNIGSPKDLHLIDRNGSEGIGLFRSEFLFMEAKEAPSEALQYEAYSQVVKHLQGKTVILRLLDVGGDKPLSYLDFPEEDNPFLGWRGVRMYPDAYALFASQIRAALRAAVYGDLWLMIPMISNVFELRWVKDEIKAIALTLEQEGIAHHATPKVGVMIETPAAALIAKQLAKEADFFSIGTNDLTQYTLAVDRAHPVINALYDDFHPAVLSLMNMTCEAAHEAGIEVGICGEMGGRLEALPLLLGMGFDELSISGRALPKIKQRIRALNAAHCRQLLQTCMALEDAAAVRQQLRQFQS